MLIDFLLLMLDLYEAIVNLASAITEFQPQQEMEERMAAKANLVAMIMSWIEADALRSTLNVNMSPSDIEAILFPTD